MEKTPKTLGGRLKIARESVDGEKLTQAALAKAAGISQTTVADIERGRNDGSKHIVALARALKCSIDWLEKGEGNMMNSSDMEFSDIERQIIQGYRAAPESQRKIFMLLAEGFINGTYRRTEYVDGEDAGKVDLHQRKVA